MAFLNADVNDFDMAFGLSLFIDFNKTTALRKPDIVTDEQYGRLTPSDLGKIVKISELFGVSATAAATISLADVEVSVDFEGLEDVSDYIPTYNMNAAFHIRREAALTGKTGRRLVQSNVRQGPDGRRLQESRQLLHDGDLLRVGTLHQEESHHPGRVLLRSLSANNPSAENYVFDKCPIDMGEIGCAKLYDMTLNMEKVKDFVDPIIKKWVNTDKSGQLGALFIFSFLLKFCLNCVVSW